MRASPPAPFQPKCELLYDRHFKRELRWDVPVRPTIGALSDVEREQWREIVADEQTGSYSYLRVNTMADEAAHAFQLVTRVSDGKWQPLFRVDGSVSRYTYWATTCGVGEYQYHHDDAPVAPELLDGDLLGLVKSTLKSCGIEPDACLGVNINRYSGQDQSCGAHSDDDLMIKRVEGDLLYPNTIISLSLGAPMIFDILSANKRKKIAQCELGDGAILTMEGYFQSVFLHRVRKTQVKDSCRYNLTIRFLTTHTECRPGFH